MAAGKPNKRLLLPAVSLLYGAAAFDAWAETVSSFAYLQSDQGDFSIGGRTELSFSNDTTDVSLGIALDKHVRSDHLSNVSFTATSNTVVFKNQRWSLNLGLGAEFLIFGNQNYNSAEFYTESRLNLALGTDRSAQLALKVIREEHALQPHSVTEVALQAALSGRPSENLSYGLEANVMLEGGLAGARDLDFAVSGYLSYQITPRLSVETSLLWSDALHSFEQDGRRHRFETEKTNMRLTLTYKLRDQGPSISLWANHQSLSPSGTAKAGHETFGMRLEARF